MKRLLLLSYAFPPAAQAGALRPGYLAHYLGEFGWDVTVVTHSQGTPPWPARIHHVGSYEDELQRRLRPSLDSQNAYAWHRKAMRYVKDLLLFPDTCAPWILPAFQTCLRLTGEERFDAILSTALPASLHVAAGLLARKTGIPWVADYRDPWTGNRYVEWGAVRKQLHKVAERRILRKAAALTTISEPIAQYLRAFHRRSDVHVIPNAYDPADWSDVPETPAQEFNLCYTGTMYGGKRPPDLLFAAIAQLRAQQHPAGNAVQVHFYGKCSDQVPEAAARFGIADCVHCHGSVPRSEALAAQRASAAVLIFLNMDPATRHETGSKYLEYLGAGRPMLTFGPSGSALQPIIERNDLGWFACDAAAAVQAVRNAYDIHTGVRHFQPHTSAFVTARELAQRFATVLDTVAGSTPRSAAA